MRLPLGLALLAAAAVGLDPGGHLESFELKAGPGRVYRATRQADGSFRGAAAGRQ